MKKFTFVISVLFICALTGCNNAAGKNQITDQDSLKKISSDKEDSINWTGELEKKKLTYKIDRFSLISDSLPLNPEVFMAFEAGNPQFPVYPQLEGIGSLDISDLDKSAASVINNFCSSFFSQKQENCETMMNEGCLFALVLFNYDVGKIGFGTDTATWIFGKPFIAEEVFQVPVRFYNKNGTCDVMFFMANSSKNNNQVWKIQDIMIYNYQVGGKSNGK